VRRRSIGRLLEAPAKDRLGMKRNAHSSQSPQTTRNGVPTVGCSALLGAALAFVVAPMIQRRLACFIAISRVSFGPALTIVVLGAVIGAALGWRSMRARKW